MTSNSIKSCRNSILQVKVRTWWKPAHLRAIEIKIPAIILQRKMYQQLYACMHDINYIQQLHTACTFRMIMVELQNPNFHLIETTKCLYSSYSVLTNALSWHQCCSLISNLPRGCWWHRSSHIACMRYNYYDYITMMLLNVSLKCETGNICSVCTQYTDLL